MSTYVTSVYIMLYIAPLSPPQQQTHAARHRIASYLIVPQPPRVRHSAAMTMTHIVLSVRVRTMLQEQ